MRFPLRFGVAAALLTVSGCAAEPSNPAQLWTADGEWLGTYTAHGFESAIAPEFVAEAEQQILALPALGANEAERRRRLADDGLVIRTTLDWAATRAAAAAMAAVTGAGDVPSAGVVMLRRSSGEVMVMAAHHPQQATPLPVLAEAGRKTGSAFKPIVLTAAFLAGFSPDSQFPAPQCVPARGIDGTPLQACGGTGGMLDLVEATVRSVNPVYVQLIEQVGPPEVVALARSLGVTRSPLAPVTGTAIGENPVTVIEMATVFNTLANSGRYSPPSFVAELVEGSGRSLLTAAPEPAVQIVPPEVADLVDEILVQVVERGTGRAARTGGRVAGKTGTSLTLSDAWFIGYTADVVAAVWVGFTPDEDRSMVPPATPIEVVGGSWPAEIWRQLVAQTPNEP